MDWNASVGLILMAAFGIGALHALEPGHGKSIMGAYIVASRGGIRHALLLGLTVTVTHTLVVFLLALGALFLAGRFASSQVTYWLSIVSGVLVVGVGAWMLLTAFGLVRRDGEHGHHAEGHKHPHEPPSGHHHHAHDHGHEGSHAQAHGHAHAHDHPHEHTGAHTQEQHHHPEPGGTASVGGHSHEFAHSHQGHTHEVRLPAGKDPLGVWTLLVVGASGGLVPCPAALTALLAAVSLGRTATGIAVVAAMSLGIAATLVAIGIVFVQAGRVASRMFGARVLSVYAPRASAVVITLLGIGLLARTIVHGH